MSHFTFKDLDKLGNALAAAGWSAEDVTRFCEAGEARLVEIRLSLSKSDIVSATKRGKTKLLLRNGKIWIVQFLNSKAVG